MLWSCCMHGFVIYLQILMCIQKDLSSSQLLADSSPLYLESARYFSRRNETEAPDSRSTGRVAGRWLCQLGCIEIVPVCNGATVVNQADWDIRTVSFRPNNSLIEFDNISPVSDEVRRKQEQNSMEFWWIKTKKPDYWGSLQGFSHRDGIRYVCYVVSTFFTDSTSPLGLLSECQAYTQAVVSRRGAPWKSVRERQQTGWVGAAVYAVVPCSSCGSL